MEQELFALPGHMSSLRSLGGHVTRSLVLCAMFCRSLFVLLAIVLSVLRFWFLVWHLQALLVLDQDAELDFDSARSLKQQS